MDKVPYLLFWPTLYIEIRYLITLLNITTEFIYYFI